MYDTIGSMSTGGSQFKVNGETHYQRNRQKYLDKSKVRSKMLVDYVRTIKKNGSCADCGIKDWRVLDFDHLPEYEKSFTIGSTIRYRSIAALDAEIAKCELVCANCHECIRFALCF